MSFHFSYRFRISSGKRVSFLETRSVLEDVPHTKYGL